MMTHEEIVTRARECYKTVSATEMSQRQREREDLLFQIADNQWDDRAKLERDGGIIDGVPTPRRPRLSIDQLKHPIQLVYNSFVKSKLGVLLHPVSADATDKNAEAKQGLYRRIERDSNATQARAWALNRSVKAGRGWWRVTTDWDEDGDDEWDQEIRIERILYQENVFMDPAAVEPDYSDGKWCLYVAWMDSEDAAREFPDVEFPSASSTLDWNLFENQAPGWVQNEEDGKRSVLVAEYWWKDINQEVILGGPNGMKRKKAKVTVYCAKICGTKLLEEPYRWPGRLLPFVPSFGEELIPVDGKRVWQGMIRPARDPQQAFNFGFSALVERAAAEPKTPYIADPKQIAGYEAWWNQANTRNFPYLPFNSIIDGQVVPPPQRAQLDTTGLSIAQIVIAAAKDGVQSATAVFDAGLGALPERRDSQSGRAIVALQQQGEAGTDQYVTSMAEVSMRYEAMVVMDLMPHIYDRAGRITRILTGEDDAKTIMLGAPFIRNAEGFPVRPPQGHPKDQAEEYDLRKGKYSISVSVGKSAQTMREAGERFLTELTANAPQLLDMIGDLVFKYRDEPGSKEISERFHRMIQARNPQILDDGEDGAQQAQAKLQAATMQLQELQKQAQAMDEALKTKQAEQQAKIQIAQMEGQIKLQLAQLEAQRDLQKTEMDNAAKIEVARISAAAAAFDTVTAAEEEEKATGLKVGAEMAKVSVEHAHEERMANQGRQHDAAMQIHGSEDEPERPEAPEQEAMEGEA